LRQPGGCGAAPTRSACCASAKYDGQVLAQMRGFAIGTRTRNTGPSSGGSLTVSNHPCMVR
jgi:hypothetical protein